MMQNKKIVETLKNPWKLFYLAATRGLFTRMPDDQYLKCMFRARMGRKLDLDNPQTFNEKLQWLKLYNRRPEYTKMVDKYLVRDYITKTIGEEYLIPLLGVWDDPDEIDFDALPDQFVLKCNHNSGTGMCICKDKSKLDIEKVKKELRKGLAQDYYLTGREWPYKDVPRKIVCERYMEDSTTGALNDYKVFIFNGKARCIQVDYDRFTDHHRNFYNMDWKYIPFTTCYPTNPSHVVEKPDALEEMLGLAEKIAGDLRNPPFVRIDFYIVDGNVYFGEITFYHGSGYETFTPEEYDTKLGDWIVLPENV